MAFQLTLSIEYQDDTHWRWVLSDADGRFLEDQKVALDDADPTYEIFKDLPRQLRFNENVRPAEELLNELGAWMGAKVFGKIGEKLLAYERSPTCVVQVRVPPEAQNLLFRPFELAHLGGKPLAERGLRLIYTMAHAPGRKIEYAVPKDDQPPETLRVLGVFSLPRDATPLNLRQERYRLQQLVQDFVRKGNRAVELRLLQYGTTREVLADVLKEPPGWDVMHFSGHGLEGELILEKPDGTADRIDTEELIELLRPARARLKLLTLLACYSRTADLLAARAQVGLHDVLTHSTPPEQSATVLPILGQRLAEELDCAVLAMRYPVLDDFAAELVLTLYDRLLEKRQPLPQALQLALDDALDASHNPSQPTFSRLTPLLFGSRAADLRLKAPPRPPSFSPPEAALFHFPPMPERFVGRLMPMLNASRALAPQSGKTGVIFYGMAGVGKTACAVELAYRYDPQNVERFTAFVWHKAPEENHDIADALTQFALSLENQLPGLELVGLMDDPQAFERRALPRLRSLLEHNSILLVLDNLEGLLTARGEWRDPRWGELLGVLLNHDGISRLVLTSRRLPASLADNARLQIDVIHALSFPESVLLARQLPNLKELFDNSPGREKLQRILLAAQGHPKLLELADATAADPVTLDVQLTRAETASVGADTARMAFFESGQSDQPEDVFVNELRRSTDDIAQTLTPTARLLAQFLARLEDPDRTLDVVQDNWEDFLKRLTGERGEEPQPAPEPALSQAHAALAEPDFGLEVALPQLSQSGLIEIEPEAIKPTFTRQQFRLHPGVAEALLLSASPSVINAVDIELGDYFIGMFQHGMKTEMQGGGRLVVEGAQRATPYLLRAQRWKAVTSLLEHMISRDNSPETLASVIPLLRRSAEQVRGTENELEAAEVLANALLQIGRYGEAEVTLNEVVARASAEGNYRLALKASGHRFSLLLNTGRLQEALTTAEEIAAYTYRAGLGPWTQLAAEGRRLNVLIALGHYSEALAAVEQKLSQMKELPEASADEEAVVPWNVREALLDVGAQAAFYLKQWETALSLNTESVKSKQQRGADEFEIARTRFDAYAPLLRMRRYDEARHLLEYCRGIFERERAVYELGNTYHALAALEDIEGSPASAARFEQTALRYNYQRGEPDLCARSHHNLAKYIERAAGDPLKAVLAHRLAAGVIGLQIGSGALSYTIRSLAISTLPPKLLSFGEICAVVEEIEGVRFQDLFAQLPKRAPDGDAAIRMVWEMVEKFDLEQEASRRRETVLQKFEPVLQTITAGARGDAQARAAIEEVLPQLEENGWHISDAVRRIWEGQRDAETLTVGLDEQEAILVRRTLELASELDETAPSAVKAVGQSETAILLSGTAGSPSQARLFFERAGFETRDLSPDTFFCLAEKNVWENRFPRPIHTNPIYTECYFGKDLTRNAVNDIFERARRAYYWRLDLIFVIVDRVPPEEGWIEIQALRGEVQVIPVDYATIRQGLAQQSEKKEIDKLLRRFLGKGRNLYNERHPIADSLSFFGRESRANELLAMLRNRRPVALFGLRKMGKSSLLKYLHNRADFPVAYIDLQFSSEPKEVFRKILEDWQTALQISRPALGWSHSFDAADPFTSFAANARDLITRLESLNYPAQLGIFLDEIEIIAPSAIEIENKKFDEESLDRYLSFARTMRGLVQETDAVALMVVGVDPQVNRESRFMGKQNPFYQFFSEEYLEPLSHEDCIQMIRNIGSQMNLKYDDDAAASIAGLSGGHPFLARQLCSMIVEAIKVTSGRRPNGEGAGSVEEITMKEVESAAEEFIRAPQTAALLNEEGLWGEVTDSNLWPLPQVEENRSILIELADSGDEPEDALLAAGHDREARKLSLHGLKQKAVVGSFEELLRIRMKLFSDWIKRYQISHRS